MTAAFLQSALASLISDSKRKNSDVKTAAEKSSADLKAISVTSETQLAGDLIRKPYFIEPFLLACRSQNVKLASSGAASLQRLVASKAIPRPRLLDVLQSFEEAVPLALEVQLKILQTLPSLLQLYAEDIHGEAISMTLSVCADLSSSKNPVVSSTASATFQQLVTAVLERATNTRHAPQQDDKAEDNETRDTEDALAVFTNLCMLLTEAQTPFVRLQNLPPSAVLEALESLLASHGNFVLGHAETREVCEKSLIPSLSILIEDSANFGVVTRALRIIFIFTSQHLDSFPSAIGEVLKEILKISDRAGNKWKRVLGLEFFRGLCSDFDALSRIFAFCDLDDNNPDVVSSLMSLLVRTASDDPSLIGLGRQSTIPTSKNVGSNLDATGAIDVPGSGITIGSVTQASVGITGISIDWSTMSTTCLDQFDRSAPPEIPDTYVYTLVLGCASAFSDCVSKFIMPLSVPTKKSTREEDSEGEDMSEQESKSRPSMQAVLGFQQRQQLMNPLSRRDSERPSGIENCAKMIETCWPAILASCSTFLNAALDSHFYHILIRTVQKLTQVSGVLELFTPRDALLTTLAKVSVPANVSTLMNALYGAKLALRPEIHGEQDVDNVAIRSPIQSTPRQSIDLTSPTLNVRNLLCLRALLNLGIALGPSLSESAWTIIFQSLAQVEALMSVSPSARLAPTSTNASDTNDGSASTTLAAEVSAVDVARRRMIDSTKTYSDAALRLVCKALFEMIEDVIPGEHASSRGFTGGERPKAPTHKSSRSVSGNWAKTATLDVEVQFVLKSIGRLASVNLYRFGHNESSAASWGLIVAPLLRLQSNSKLRPHLRLQTANIIDGIVVESSRVQVMNESIAQQPTLLQYGIPALGKQLVNAISKTTAGDIEVELEIIRLMLSALENIVGSHGESLEVGWTGVFEILNIVTDKKDRQRDASETKFPFASAESRTRLYPAAFKVVQLIVSDFLSTLDGQSVSALLGLFEAFGSQEHDLNMSLTTIALFRNVITLVLDRCERLSSISSLKTKRCDSDSDLWQTGILELSYLCKDDRPDVRNAAMRMLLTIVEASVPKMSSESFNSCLTVVLLPLLEFYSNSTHSRENSWHQSCLRLVEDLTSETQKYTTLLLEAEDFSKTWLHLIRVYRGLLEAEDTRTLSIVYSSLSDMIVSIRGSDHAASLSSNENLLRATWECWSEKHPASIKGDVPNQEALAAHARLMIELSTINVEAITRFDNSINDIMSSSTKSVLEARHERYTIDVNKVSPEQEQILLVLGILQKLMVNNKLEYAQYLLSIIDKLVINKSHDPSLAGASTSRKPTGIAFATACVGKLRSIVQTAVSTADLMETIPAQQIIDLSAHLAATKYSQLPSNPSNTLWQIVTLLGTECLTMFSKHLPLSQPEQLTKISDSINTLLTSILATPHLENLPLDQRPVSDTIETDTTFDMLRFHEIHAASHALFTHCPTSDSSLKQYILTLFHHSLIARPWHDDFPTDLTSNPLKNFTALRRGSIRRPNLPPRSRISPEALNALISLVSQTSLNNNDSSTSNGANPNLTMHLATLAAPLLVLRLIHPLKTFLADQPLRYLTPPPAPLLTDLALTLNTALTLRIQDEALKPTVADLNLNNNNNNNNTIDIAATIRPDGKTHLRILYSFILRFEAFWNKLPRLKRGHAWQDRADARAVEEAMGRWKEVVAEGWGPVFERGV